MDLVPLIKLLADGQWHHVDDAGESQALLYAVGLTSEISGDGRARLIHAIELLNADTIQSKLKLAQSVTVEVTGVVDSTNTQLLKQPHLVRGNSAVLLAEYQTGGKGRRGRSWLSPYAGGICLSVAWKFAPIPQQPGTLSLVTGVAVLRALAAQGIEAAQLKWPNDLLYDNRKLGGVLIEASQTDNALHVVAGIGLNLRLTTANLADISASGGVPPVALSEIDPVVAANRTALAVGLIDNVFGAFNEFQQKGFEPFEQEYNHADVLRGCAVHVTGPDSELDGQAMGIDDSGALLVRAGTMTHRLLSGEVRVRK